ncbi:WYL domain-containing protein [Neisseria sp. ZJ106]|uniref:WYL domain-containing protein n=1 Tax=Neisseria lisongii TaxID=2912188 RepID=A0ABY7RMC2_9NEIS|nr:WYL domain-containing protein [Neisseria lisongii]MCF7521678.1 WYL domain-containing protein [Neisseria lisongii]WCL72235.1 WYL domain-containing protein [Neisseria lisongii]
MKGKHEKLAYRLTEILCRLNKGERLDIQQLAEEFQTTPRTIQRDLNERLDFLAWNEQGPRHYSLDKAKLGHLYPQDIERFARFCSIQDLLPQIDRRFYQEHLTQSVQIKGFQYEDIKDKLHEFQLINHAVEHRNPIEFHYRKAGQESGKYYTLEPYALLNRNGIWYVIGIDCAAGKQKTFCFTQMAGLNRQNTCFEHNPELLQAIQDNDSIYHGNQVESVIIRISAKAAPYFQRRALLPNQQILEKLNDGGLLLKCENVNEMEIVPIVQYWLPDATIISPETFQQKMEQRLRNYLGK